MNLLNQCYNLRSLNKLNAFVKIIVNGEKISLPQNSNIEDLILHLGYQNQRIAIEINESIIPKSSYSLALLKELDKIEVISAVGGG